MAKLQDLADAFEKSSSGAESISIVDHTTYQRGYDPIRITSIMRGNQTLGHLSVDSGGRWSFRAPDEAKFNDVAPLMKAIEDANLKLDVPDSGPATE